MSKHEHAGLEQNTTTPPRTSATGVLHKTTFNMNKAERGETVLEFVLRFITSAKISHDIPDEYAIFASATPTLSPVHTLGAMRIHVECGQGVLPVCRVGLRVASSAVLLQR